MTPAASNLNYAIYNKELPVQSPTWTEQELSPNTTLGFELGASYVLPNTTGNDVTLDWTHLNSSASATIVAPNADFFIGPDWEIGPDSTVGRAAAGNVNFKYDIVNLTAGQYIDFGNHVEMRFFGGLSAAWLRQNLSMLFSGNIPSGIYAGPFSTLAQSNFDFKGVGPRAGMQIAYVGDSGFGIMGTGAVSALVGNSHAVLNFASSAVELSTVYGQNVNYQNITDQNNTQVIPGIDAKLALTFERIFRQGPFVNVGVAFG